MLGILKKINHFISNKGKINYISDNADWVIEEIGKELKNELYMYGFKIKYKISYKNNYGILHFPTRYSVFEVDKLNKDNKVVLTYFHGDDSDENILTELRNKMKCIDVIHTSCNQTKYHLIRNNINPDKIIIVPIGISINLFSPSTNSEKENIKKNFGIPENHIVIGSFQKDGNGWGEGNEPKLIKGPDIFCDVIKNLSKKYPIYVLLTGPARGYVKKCLQDASVPFKHFYFKNYNNISKYYKAIDLYIITSRLEGGPRSIMECHASGVPLVSTKVGMAPDIISHGLNGFLADSENVDEIVSCAEQIINNASLRDSFVKNGLETVQRFDWSIIAREYYDKIYSKLL